MIRNEKNANLYGFFYYLINSVSNIFKKRNSIPTKISKDIFDMEINTENQLSTEKKRIFKLEDCSIISKEGLVINSKNELVLEHYYCEPFKSNSKLRKSGFISLKFHVQFMIGLFKIPQSTIEIDNAIILNTRWSENYYHWLIDIITKFENVENFHDEYPVVIINGFSRGFHKETLEHFSSKFRFIETSNEHIYKVKNLLLNKLVGTNSEKINYLRKIYLPKVNFFKEKNIYISRANDKKRIIKNEKELILLLKQFDFKIVHLENLKFQEQVNLFYNANCILAPHGAGLTNLVFSNKDCSIIEILPDKKINNYTMYQEISKILGFNYKNIIGNSINNNKYIVIDLEKIKNILNETITKMS